MKKLNYYLLALTFTGCSIFEGPEGKGSLLETHDEPAGQNCNSGGIKITAGIDSNGNGLLEASEITSTKYICNGLNGSNGTNGSNGLNSLITTKEIAAGSTCPSGGLQIDSGQDTNNNGVLDNSEVQSSKYVCNGQNGLYDKMTQFKLRDNINNETNPMTLVANLVQFDVSNYPADSIVFIAYDIQTKIGCCPGSDVAANCPVELLDRSDDSPVPNSQIVSDNIPDGTFKQSANLKNSFPNRSIDLAVRISGEAGVFNVTGGLYLLIIKK